MVSASSLRAFRNAALWRRTGLALALFAATSLPAMADLAPQSGHWAIVGEEGLGSGININIQNQRVGLTIFTYDENGASTWYLATGAVTTEGTLIEGRLIGARDGQALDQDFTPATPIDTGQNITLRFTNTTTGQFTLNGVTKDIRLLRFAGNTVEITGNPDPGTISEIPDVEGEWALITRAPGQTTQTRLLQFRRLFSFQPVGGDVPDAALIYEHIDNNLSRAYFYCDTYAFDGLGLRLPSCNLRFVESERITEYEIPTANISLDRFDAQIIPVPGSQVPEIFAVKVGALPPADETP